MGGKCPAIDQFAAACKQCPVHAAGGDQRETDGATIDLGHGNRYLWQACQAGDHEQAKGARPILFGCRRSQFGREE